ncbi:hypothetical protein [Nocardioides jejuensis]|uniref:Uncharacterized protein n=1 Tax=Nocardioides jejuensis TaxID=2502782 RepID=A0A4R1BT39_9ACTN|nr:hypothetical protein [Nocardioides jejuensis]TCJ21000.1 hypothetical protein EPD65_15920 [Nocardioides jejuensis]
MPEPDEIARAAGRAARLPDFDALVARGARRRRLRRTVAGVGLAGAVAGTTLTVLALGRAPEPAPTPAPHELSGLVFTRDDGTTFRSGRVSVACVRSDASNGGPEAEPSTEVIRVSGRVGERPASDDVAWNLRMEVPIADARDGLTLSLPTTEPAYLFVGDVRDGNELSSAAEGSSGTLKVLAASCGPRPSITFTVDGLLGSEFGDLADVAVAGGLTVTADAPTSPAATADARLSALVHSQTDPAIAASVWRRCEGGSACRFRVAVTDDGFRTRHEVSRAFASAPVVVADGGRFHLQGTAGLGWILDTDGTLQEVQRGSGLPESPGPVFMAGDGAWMVLDMSAATAYPVRAPEGADRLSQVVRLDPTPGSRDYNQPLLGLSYADGVTAYLSSDSGGTWQPLGELPEALYGVVRRADGGPALLVEGGDGATLFPFDALQELAEDGTFHRTPMGSDPRAYVGPQVVLADGTLLSSVEAWSDSNGAGTGTPPGLYASDGDDWTTLRRVRSGAPYDDPRTPVDLLDVLVDGESVTLVAGAPAGDDQAAYSSTDGGRTWRAMPAR